MEPGAIDVLTHGATVRPRSTAFLASIAAAIITDGLEVLVQLVIEAIETMPWSISKVAPSAVVTLTFFEGRPAPSPSSAGLSPPLVPSVLPCRAVGSLAGKLAAAPGVALVVGDVGRQHLAEGVLGVGERDAVLRALRAGDGRHDGRQVELELLGVARLGLVRAGVQPHALLLGVGLDQRDRLVGATGEAQVLQRHVVDREDRAGRAELRAHVADRGAVGQRHRPRRPRRRTRRTCRRRRGRAASR